MKGVSVDPYRASISSVLSFSSQGSEQDDDDFLGDVFMWGEGTGSGILGGGGHRAGSITGERADALLPKALSSAHVLDVQYIACGRRHATLVTRIGEVYSWGEESGSLLGHAVVSDAPYPLLVEALADMTIESIACGEYHTCAVTVSGDLYTWGDGEHGFDLLGHGNDTSQWLPKRVSGPLEGIHVSSVACGTWHTALITLTGQLFTFGDGTFGVLGHGDRNNASFPREVDSLRGLKTIAVACGVWHTAAVVDIMVSHSDRNNLSGKIFTWGDGDTGCLVHGDADQQLVPTCVSALIDYDFQRVSCGHSLTIALSTSGKVFTMGSTAYGQLGNPGADGKLPVLVEGKLREAIVEDISCGTHHVAVLTTKAEVFTWGKGANGRLGHGDFEDRNFPTLVKALKDKRVKSIACGSCFTVAICLHKWASGTEQSICAGCSQSFSFTRKRHNCYNCGLVFCRACSSKKAYNASMAPNLTKSYRVCDSCHIQLKNMSEPGAAVQIPFTKKLRQFDIKEKLEKIDGKYPVSQMASSFIPGLHFDGRSALKFGKKCDLSSTCTAATSVSDSFLWVEKPASAVSDVLTEGSRSNAAIVPSQTASVSSFSDLASPFCLTNPTPAMKGFTSSKGGVCELKHMNDMLTQQIEKLTLQNRKQEVELQHAKAKLQDALAMANEEATKLNAARGIIKSLTTQLHNVTRRLAVDAQPSITFRADPINHLPPNKLHSSFAVDVTNQTPKYMDLNPDSYAVSPALIEVDQAPTQTSVFASKNMREVNSSDSVKSQASDKVLQYIHLNINGEKITASDIANKVRRASLKTDIPAFNSGQGSASEWVEPDEPGVYLTFVSSAVSGKELKRVKFSRRRFSEKQAEIWWAENSPRIFEKYNLQKTEKSASGKPVKMRLGDHSHMHLPS